MIEWHKHPRIGEIRRVVNDARSRKSKIFHPLHYNSVFVFEDPNRTYRLIMEQRLADAIRTAIWWLVTSTHSTLGEVYDEEKIYEWMKNRWFPKLSKEELKKYIKIKVRKTNLDVNVNPEFLHKYMPEIENIFTSLEELKNLAASEGAYYMIGVKKGWLIIERHTNEGTKTYTPHRGTPGLLSAPQYPEAPTPIEELAKGYWEIYRKLTFPLSIKFRVIVPHKVIVTPKGYYIIPTEYDHPPFMEYLKFFSYTQGSKKGQTVSDIVSKITYKPHIIVEKDQRKKQTNT